MPTIRQRKLAKAVIENLEKKDSLNLQELLVSIGYAESTAKHEGTFILNEVGTIKALAELGFTADNAKGVVASILLDKRKKDDTRLKAAEQIFKVTGAYAPEKSININLNSIPIGDQTDSKIEELFNAKDSIRKDTDVERDGSNGPTPSTES